MIFMVMVPLAVMSVLVKVAQVDFITEKIVWDWSAWEYLALAGFINNLAGLRGDHDASKMTGMFLLLDHRDPKALQQIFFNKLAASAVEHYGVAGSMVVVGTLSTQDVCKLLNPRNCLENSRHEPDDQGMYEVLKPEVGP